MTMTTTLLTAPAGIVPRLHTTVAAAAFVTAIIAACLGGTWKDLCRNSVSEWPIEWLPSVSATIGDHPASRSPFHILIALCATPRFLLLGLQWLSHRPNTGQTADLELAIGLARTFSCGGWVYITSTDNHDLHDLFMIIYLVLTLPWMILATSASLRPNTQQRRRWTMYGFIGTLPFLIWQYYRHSILRIPGSYTHYAFFEWGLVIWDILFDSFAAADLENIKIVVMDSTGKKQPPAPAAREEDWTRDEVVDQTQRIAAFLSDVVFGMTFWTVFTSLPFQLFYWSVWKLALSGSELALLANLSPLLLANRSIRYWVQSRSGLIWLRSTSAIFGLGCYAAPSPILRLMSVFIGVGAGWLAILSPLIRIRGGGESKAEAQVLLIALVALTLLKHANSSINPFWASSDAGSGGWNKWGLAVVALSTWELSNRSLGLFPGAPSALKDKPLPRQPADIAIALGFGALVHLLHTFATDPGTIIAWSWTGFPIKGPTLHPFGGLVLAVSAAAAATRINARTAAVLVAAGCGGLNYSANWPSFASGLIAIFGLLSAFPAYLQAVSALPLAHTFGWAMGTYALLDVVSVVTAAYAFVPLGYLVRERTDLILAFCCFFFAAGVRKSTPTQVLSDRAAKRISSTHRYSLVLAAALAISSLAYGCWKMPRAQPVPYSQHRIFTGGIWTVHFGVDEDGRDSQHRMMELLRDMEVDVVGLLESDLHRMVYGNRDLTRVIAEELGYYVDLGPGPNHHTWGAALLSKFPIINSTHHLLPSPRGELAPAIHATLDIHGEMVNVMVSHNGQEEDPLDRELQTTEIARLLRETADTPTVFLGYLVTEPGAERPAPYQILIEDGMMNDIEKDDKFRWCEYIAFRGLWRIGYARVHESTITDTELQVGKFILPEPGTTVRYDNDGQMYWHIGEDDIPEPWRMPAMFRNEGVRGHRYVVWAGGPIYYMPPEHSGLQLYGR